MSWKGNCWDNVVMELFFGRLKVELIYVKNYQLIEEVCLGIFVYIEIFYNCKRRYLVNDGFSFVVFEEIVVLVVQLECLFFVGNISFKE